MIEGRKVYLRDWSLDDVPVFEKWHKPGHLWQSLDAPYYRSEVDDSKRLVTELLNRIGHPASQPRTSLVISDKESNQLIGRVSSYWESEETNWLCIGIVIYDQEHWGKGIGYEALGLWIEYLFKEHTKIIRLDMRTWSGNTGLASLAKKLGFIQEACFRKARIVNGEYYDGLGFGLLKDEWLQLCPLGFESKT